MPTFLSLLRAGATREQLEEWCREKTQSYASGAGELVCRVLGKYLMFAATGDTALTPHLALNGIWESWITMAIANHVKPGMRCMDVGACYGYYSVLMADIVGKHGAVQAWEPVWGKAVLANVDINGFDVEVRSALIGTTGGEYEFWMPPGHFNAGNIKLSECVSRLSASHLSRVPMHKPAPEAWDFIKIDVEGAEADVWEALAGVREQSPNLTVCMEFTPSEHEKPGQFLAKLVEDGFELGTVGHDGVPRSISLEEALVPDTGGFRMLWLKGGASAPETR